MLVSEYRRFFLGVYITFFYYFFILLPFTPLITMPRKGLTQRSYAKIARKGGRTHSSYSRKGRAKRSYARKGRTQRSYAHLARKGGTNHSKTDCLRLLQQLTNATGQQAEQWMQNSIQECKSANSQLSDQDIYNHIYRQLQAQTSHAAQPQAMQASNPAQTQAADNSSSRTVHWEQKDGARVLDWKNQFWYRTEDQWKRMGQGMKTHTLMDTYVATRAGSSIKPGSIGTGQFDRFAKDANGQEYIKMGNIWCPFVMTRRVILPTGFAPKTDAEINTPLGTGTGTGMPGMAASQGSKHKQHSTHTQHSTVAPPLKSLTSLPAASNTQEGPEATSTSDWQQYIDEQSKAPYWYNNKTGQSTWNNPTESTETVGFGKGV